MEFCIQCADCRRTDILVGFKAVTTSSHSDSVDFRLIWVHSANKIAASGFGFSGTCFGLTNNSVLFPLITSHGLHSLESPIEQCPISLVSDFNQICLLVPARRVSISPLCHEGRMMHMCQLHCEQPLWCLVVPVACNCSHSLQRVMHRLTMVDEDERNDIRLLHGESIGPIWT